jgi:hypothetical protein
MRKQRVNVESIPIDGGIRLIPGAYAAFDVDTPFSPSYGELVKWMTDIRGGVLVASFGIENELILMPLADEFGSNDKGAVGSDYFLREQEWREQHSLKRKIDRVKPIIRKRGSPEQADRIIQKLAEYRELRNLLAHYPCWLEPVNQEGITEPEKWRTIGLKLYIADRNYVWEVDAQQAKKWNDLLLFVRVAVENIRREMLGAPLMNADGSLPEPEQLPNGVPVTKIIQHGNVAQAVVPAVRGSPEDA